MQQRHKAGKEVSHFLLILQRHIKAVAATYEN